MTHVKTKSGFECDIDTEVLNDFEVLEQIAALDRGDVTAYPPFLAKLLPDEDKKRLYDHCRTETGRVPIDTVSKEIAEIMEELNSSGKK